jgi:hypothetical protein
MVFEELFHMTPESARERFGTITFRRLQEALDDFNLVLLGHLPIHAKVDQEQPLLTDGGTTFYIGDGYKLTVLMSLNGIMRGDEYIHGYIYGPMISFGPEVMSGNYPAIHHLTFYTGEDLKELLKR